MTIDEAIKYADLMSRNVNTFEATKQFAALCAYALRVMKEASDKPNGENAVPELRLLADARQLQKLEVVGVPLRIG